MFQNTIQVCEVCNQEAGWLKTAVCATVVNMDRLLIGSEEGLFAYEISKEKALRIDEKGVKKVLQVDAISEEQLIVVLTCKDLVL